MSTMLHFGVNCTPDMMRVIRKVDTDMRQEKEAWVAGLRSSGVKAAHPDDGWVNRVKNYVILCYPQFNDGLQAGDLVALGWPDRYRLVRITGIGQQGMVQPIMHYYFTAQEGGEA